MTQNNDLMPKFIRPSVKEVEIVCKECNSKDTIFFTNREIWSNQIINQYCDKCDKFMEWHKR